MTIKIAVSRGHGKYTAGKRSPAGEREWYFNDKVADAFVKEMKKYSGVAIKEVSDPSGNVDTGLVARTNAANNWGATVYAAFHHNANTGRWGNWTGSEVHVRPNASQSYKLASMIAPRISKAMNIQNRGVKVTNLHETREPNQLAFLVEGGFMDSKIDITALRRNDMLAEQGRQVAYAVADYFNLKRKSGASAPSKPASKPAAKPKTPSKITGSSYTVKKGDTLWGISKASGVSVSNLKSWNNLKSDLINAGDKLTLKKPAKKSSGSSAKWQYNKHTGAQWKPLKGVWINGDQPIKKRKGSPELDAPSTGWMKPGQRLDYREIARNDGHIWLLDLKSDQWIPVKTWNSKTGAVGKDWGTWK